MSRSWAERTLHLEKQSSKLGSAVLVKSFAVACNAKERSLIASTCALTGSGKATQHMFMHVFLKLNSYWSPTSIYFLKKCPIFHSTWIPPPFSLRWHVPVLALCRWLTLGLSSLGKIEGIAEGWQPTNPWFFQRIWDANEPTSFVAHSYDFAINGYVSLCGRSYQKSATCLRFIEIYVDFPWFWFTSFRSCCERNKGKLGTNYGPINELQVCLVVHASCSFQSCDCFKICRIVIYII